MPEITDKLNKFQSLSHSVECHSVGRVESWN